MNRLIPVSTCAAAALGLLLCSVRAQDAATPAAPPSEPAAAAPVTPSPDAVATPPPATTEQRLFDLEAYITNAKPGEEAVTKDGKTDTTKWTSKIAGPGPGHNAWQMTSTALVLFMTLPGLALFYGGLVRRKNVLSVLAQCLGIAGMVTILWWICGYSLCFGADAKSPFI